MSWTSVAHPEIGVDHRLVALDLVGHAVAEGEYNFDANGDGLHGYNIVKNEKGNIVFDKHIEFDD